MKYDLRSVVDKLRQNVLTNLTKNKTLPSDLFFHAIISLTYIQHKLSYVTFPDRQTGNIEHDDRVQQWVKILKWVYNLEAMSVKRMKDVYQF